MEITYRELANLAYPVYWLNTDYSTVDGLVISEDGRLIDDKNCEAKTLGLRRLQTTSIIPKYPLKRQYSEIADIIKGKVSDLIDSKGRIFHYSKTTWSSLKFLRINKVENRLTFSLVWLEGVPSPFKVVRPPNAIYAGVLCLRGMPWIIGEYSLEHKKPAKRKI